MQEREAVHLQVVIILQRDSLEKSTISWRGTAESELKGGDCKERQLRGWNIRKEDRIEKSSVEDRRAGRGCVSVCVSVGPVAVMAVSTWQALSPIQWARWGWDTLLGGLGSDDGGDPAIGLLQRLTWSSKHDYMIQTGPARQR